VIAGTAVSAFAQDTPPAPEPDPNPESTPGEEPGTEEDLRDRIRRLSEIREKRLQERLAAERAAEAAGESPPNELGGAPVDPAELTAEPGAEQISLVFDGPVDMSAFVDFVAQTLRINIIEDQGLTGRTVVFRAPITIPRAELLPLLRALVEDNGFALIREDLGFYRVRAESSVRPSWDGDLATTRIIRTPLIRPTVAAQTIAQQIGGAGAATGQGGVAAGANFRMTPVDELGIIIATGPSGTLEIIERFTQQLVAESQGQQFTRIELTNVSASYARSRVIALNAGIATGPGGAQGAAQAGQGTIASTTGLMGNLESRLYIDQGNALLFRGDESEAALLRAMIEVLDEVTPLIVRRYVAGSVAQDAAYAGERLGLGSVVIAGDSTTTSFRGGMNPTLSPTGVRGQTETGVEPAASGFTVDPETGSMIYYGTETQHARVQALVEQFKLTAIGEDIEIKTYKLLYAKAEAGDDEARGVVDILIELLETPGERTTQSPFLPGGRGGPRDAADPTLDLPPDAAPPTEGATRLLATQDNTIIVADPARNQIIIKAPRKAQAQFAEIIAKLDQKQPQVNIEVQIVSVITTDNFNWEADVQLNFGQFSWFSGFGASILEGAGTGVGTTLDPRTLPAGTPGLTTGWIKSDYLPIAINTLATIGDTRVLSKPSLLVNDNQEANFESVRTEPFSSASQGTATTIVSQGGTVDAGTTLRVVPRISAGGDITIEFDVELSDFVGAGAGGLQPPTQTESYQSYVTLPSDSTIVVGGFKLKRDSTTENKIPFLGDIPLVGNLFKNYNKTERHATIYVFITPTIMRDPLGEDLRLATRGPMEEMEIDPDVPHMDPAVIPISPRGDVDASPLRDLDPPPSTAELSSSPR
jgi:type II secretory pathway component GspD/PulD (secretin)